MARISGLLTSDPGRELRPSVLSPSQHSVDQEWLDGALNAELLKYTVRLIPRRPRDGFIVTLADYPQCRGEGPSVSEALSGARALLGVMRDCRLAWKLDELLQQGREDSR